MCASIFFLESKPKIRAHGSLQSSMRPSGFVRMNPGDVSVEQDAITLSPQTRFFQANPTWIQSFANHVKASSRVLKAGKSRREKVFMFSESASGKFSAPTHADFLI